MGTKNRVEEKASRWNHLLKKETTAEKWVKSSKIPRTSLASPSSPEEEAQRNKIEVGMRMGAEVLKAHFSNQRLLVENRGLTGEKDDQDLWKRCLKDSAEPNRSSIKRLRKDNYKDYFWHTLQLTQDRILMSLHDSPHHQLASARLDFTLPLSSVRYDTLPSFPSLLT